MRPRRPLPGGRLSRYWCRRQSSVCLQVGKCAREANLAPELARARVGLPGRNQLEASPGRLGDAGSGGPLCLVEKLGWNLDGNLTRCSHSVRFTISNTSI
jgi:hypothetical protein